MMNQELKYEEKVKGIRKELLLLKEQLEDQKEEQLQKEQDFERQVVKYHTQ